MQCPSVLLHHQQKELTQQRVQLKQLTRVKASYKTPTNIKTDINKVKDDIEQEADMRLNFIGKESIDRYLHALRSNL